MARAARKLKTTTALTVAPDVKADAFTTTTRMGFQDGTDGTPRLAWARSQTPFGYGWSAANGTPIAIGPGGRNTREATVASAVANGMLTSNPVIATIVETLVTNAVGLGLTLSSKPDATALGITPEQARALSHDIETKWAAWAGNALEVDLTGRCDLHALASASFRSWLLNGESLATIDWQRSQGARTRTKVSLLDSRQLDGLFTRLDRDRRIVNGVCFNTQGRVTGYMLRKMPIGDIGAPIATYVPAATSWGRSKVVHLFEMIDARQTRGQSPLIAALTPAQERESLAEFTLASALIQTQFSMTVETDLPPNRAFDPITVNDNLPGDFLALRNEWYGKQSITPQPGVISHLAPGDKLKMTKSETPNSTYNDFDRSLTRRAARAAGAMYEDISGDYSQTSFSASRMATETPWRLNLRRRQAIVVPFYQAVFRAWLEEACETGAIELPHGAPEFWRAPDAISCARWLGSSRPEPDRLKAAKADIEEIENGLSTYEEILAARGIDLETHIESLKQEAALMKDAGLAHPFSGAVTTQVRDETIDPPPAKTPERKALR